MNEEVVQKKPINQRALSRLLFYISIITLPLIQLSIFYVYINLNSIKLAFFTYNPAKPEVNGAWAGLDHFAYAWETFSQNLYFIRNSATMWLAGLLISTPLQFLFSFYIAKKYFGAGFFKVILFLPQIVSGLVFAILYKYMVTDVYKEVVYQLTGEKVLGLLDNMDTRFPAVVAYSIWIGFGTGMLMYSNAISAIPGEIIESAHLDGANLFQEFIYITFPSIWPTYSSMFLIHVTGILMNQGGLHAMFGTNAMDIGTIAYFIFVRAEQIAEGTYTQDVSMLSAMGLMLTLVLVPLTLFTKWALRRFGPSED